MKNILKAITQPIIDAALPGVKQQLMDKAALLSHDPRYAPFAPLILPFFSDLLNGWTVKL